jgi:hypothetical protein
MALIFFILLLMHSSQWLCFWMLFLKNTYFVYMYCWYSYQWCWSARGVSNIGLRNRICQDQKLRLADHREFVKMIVGSQTKKMHVLGPFHVQILAWRRKGGDAAPIRPCRNVWIDDDILVPFSPTRCGRVTKYLDFFLVVTITDFSSARLLSKLFKHVEVKF